MNDTSADNLLLARVARHERDALAQVYARFQRPLFSYLLHLLGRKELAEDVLQDVMVTVWQRAHTFSGATQAASWVFAIAHHQAFKALRRDARMTRVDLEAALEVEDEGPEPVTLVLRQATHDELAAALSQLSPEHREVLELAFFEDFTGPEIAAIVGIPLGTVKSRLSYARRALRVILCREGWEAEHSL